MKKFFVLSILMLALVGCSTEDQMDRENVVDNNDSGEMMTDCNLGEVYSLDELSFDICSGNEVTLGDSDGSLRTILLDGQVSGYLVEGDFENEMIVVERDELITSLENGLFGGVESNDDNGYGANYVDIAGVEALELEFLGDLQGIKKYFALVEGDLLKFDDNFSAVSVLSGIIER